ncbi:hypothetical protein VNO80_13402 [Phaseolus coccineus]|uniref:LisH domain-containing protein n=1 Tax=Phaseolus coccineus TaxID=3886 RepID=A0AAN9N1J8_PHACN
MTRERSNLSRSLLAFIVDQYLSRNQFSQTQASFRNEASSLFANAPPNQNLLSLEEMMNQYIFMKKQNTVLDKEKVMLMQEKNRIQTLLQDMQNALDIFNARSPLSNVAAMITNSALVPPIQNSNTTPPPVAPTSTVFPVQNTMSLPPKPMNNVNFSSPKTRIFDKKRKDSPVVVDGFAVTKKPRGRPPGTKKQVQGINTPLPSPINKVDFGSSSATTQSLVGNFTVKASHISINSVSTAHPTLSSFQSDTHNVCPPTAISPPVATCNEEVVAPGYNVISTKRLMVEPQEQMIYKEGNCVISPLEANCAETNNNDTNKATKRDTADKTGMRALYKSFSNEILISEFDKERDDCAHLDFSNSGLDDWSKIDFANFEIEDSFTNMSRDIEMLNQEFFDHPA